MIFLLDFVMFGDILIDYDFWTYLNIFGCFLTIWTFLDAFEHFWTFLDIFDII